MDPVSAAAAATSWTSLLLIAALLPIQSLGFGAWAVAGQPWRPAEKLLVAVAASHGLVYAVQVAVYLLGLPPGAVWVAVGINAAGLWAARASVRAWLADADVRSILIAGTCFAGALLLLTATVRNFSGGPWSGDWHEHYERARFFADGGDPGARFMLGVYSLGARPPFVNALASGSMLLGGSSFVHHQWALSLLSTAVFLPVGWLARRRSALGPWWAAALLLATPFVFQNFSYPWTRTYTSYLALAGLALYLGGLDEQGEEGPGRFVAAFCLLGAALISHYSAGPYLVFFAVHYLGFVWWRRPRRGRELGLIVVTGAAVLASWFGWAVALLGAGGAFASNTTVEGLGSLSPPEALSQMGRNLWASAVPVSWRLPRVPVASGTTDALARLRDQWFFFFQANAVGMVGLTAPWVMLGAAAAEARRPQARSRLAFGAALGLVAFGALALHPTYDRFGLGHIGLQPLALLALAWLAGRASALPGWALALLVGGKLGDWLLGVGAQVVVEARPMLVEQGGETFIRADLGRIAVVNVQHKLQQGYPYLADLLPPWTASPLQGAALLATAGLLFWAWARSSRGRSTGRSPG